MNVMVVDDEAAIRQVVSDFLTDCGHRVTTAHEGVEALRQIDSAEPVDVILSDIRMPRMNGLDLLRAVRMRRPGTPVILMTGHGDEDVAATALQEGAQDYLKKPVAFRDLMECLDRLGERQRLEEQIISDFHTVKRGGEPGLTMSPELGPVVAASFLVVTDDGACADATGGQLGDMGHDVQRVNDTSQARSLFDERPVDVVIADVDLPDGDGVGLIEELRAIDPTVVCLVIAGNYEQQTLVRALEAGASGYLTRPVQSADLQRLVTRALAERKRLVETRLLLSDLIEARGELQVRIAERERYLQHLINSAPFGIVSTDDDGRILTFNGKAEVITGRSAEDARGQKITTLLADPDGFHHETTDHGACQRECLRPDGQRVPILLHATDVYDANQRTIARLHVIEDRTEREQMETQLLQAERLSVLGQMAPRLAHEFKTPLQVIMGNADLAILSLDNGEPDECKYHLKMISPAVSQMNGLVGQMLDLGRPKESRIIAIDLAHEVTQVLDALQSLKILKACDVVTDFETDLPSIQGDPSQIEQVLRNLVVNAAHSMEGLDIRQLGITMRTEADHVAVSIRDSGSGIPADQLESIFQPFFTTKPEGKGTGLGLPIVRTILNRHGASIHVASMPDLGSTFTIRFPVRPDRETQDPALVISL